MKHKPLILKLDSETYPFRMVIYIGDKPTDETIRKHMLGWIWNGTLNEHGEGPLIGENSGAWTGQCKNGCALWLPHYTDPEFLQFFAHEMVHVVSALSNKISQFQTYLSDELHAYFAGWVAREIEIAIKNDKKRKKVKKRP